MGKERLRQYRKARAERQTEWPAPVPYVARRLPATLRHPSDARVDTTPAEQIARLWAENTRLRKEIARLENMVRIDNFVLRLRNVSTRARRAKVDSALPPEPDVT